MAARTLLTEEAYEMAEYYITSHEDVGDVVPSMAGLAFFLQIGRKTLYNWYNKDERMANIIDLMKVNQERKTLNGGLTGEYNPSISKLLLGAYGYSDKIEQDHTSSDGSMTPNQTDAAQSVIDKINEKFDNKQK